MPKPIDTREQFLARFWSHVDVGHPLGCWQWTGSRLSTGYGQIGWGSAGSRGRTLATHRVAYEELRGEKVPDGMHLDHLCRNRACCNPDHLEVVTPLENWRRGAGPHGRAIRNPDCPNVHPFYGNMLKGERYRKCKVCHRDRMRAYRARKREAAA